MRFTWNISVFNLLISEKKVQVEFQPNCATMDIIHKNEAMKAGSRVDNGIAEKRTVVICDPWNPPYPMYRSSTHKSYSEVGN
jgi:hypothetical protein